MSLALWLGFGLLVVLAGMLAQRVLVPRTHRRTAALAALPDGWLDLGALPLPYGGRRPLERMLQAYLDVSPSPFASAVRGARTRLVLDGGAAGRGVVALMPWCEANAAAPRPETCATSCAWAASNLALALGQLGPVLLVTIAPGPTLLDRNEDEADGDPREVTDAQGAGTRYWRPGMIDLRSLPAATDLSPVLISRWRERFEWVLIDMCGVRDVAGLNAALPADTIQVYVMDAFARSALQGSSVPAARGARTAVLAIDGT